MAERLITVEVVYLDADKQCLRKTEVVEGSSVLEAITASGIEKLIPSAGFDPDRLGIFSKRVPADHIVQPSDRIEIYRPLMLDPMEARRRRAR
jgi:putative ubiquitin-RnfH superfamily antitoxin RatB of RatAB toxin-antitoxin module